MITTGNCAGLYGARPWRASFLWAKATDSTVVFAMSPAGYTPPTGAMIQQKPDSKNGKGSPETLPYRLYDMSELAIELDVSVKHVRTLRRADALFTSGKRTRPEWILDWILAHINDGAMRGPIIS
jgi:hypothetical protein